MLQSLSFIHYPAWYVFRLSRQDPSADWVHFSMSQSGLEPDTWLCICGRSGSRGSPVCFKRPEAASDPPGRLAFTSPGMSRAFCGPALLTRLSSPCLASPGFSLHKNFRQARLTRKDLPKPCCHPRLHLARHHNRSIRRGTYNGRHRVGHVSSRSDHLL